MYKLLLCWRYLRTRYIALACIISVMLGVATMIVVNGVMTGFSVEMQARLNGMLGDLVLESRSMDGVADADKHMAKIRELAGDQILGMSPTVTVPSLLYINVLGVDGQPHAITRPITLVGIDETTYASVSKFGNYLQHPTNREQLQFSLRESGYDIYDHQVENQQKNPRTRMEHAGWRHRRHKAMLHQQQQAKRLAASPPATTPQQEPNTQKNPFATPKQEGRTFNPALEQHPGIVLGIGVCSYRDSNGTDHFVALPGDDVTVSFPKATLPTKAISEFYTVVDFYASKMSEYDANFAFIPIRQLQQSRGMFDPETQIGRFTSIQIKLRPGADGEKIRDQLRNHFSPQLYMVSTWRDKQGALLAAVQMETAVLNVLLFMIIAVAGFGILAIFFMIVVEKTRDIGILKSLGASGMGILGIFLSYGLSLGLVGSGVGLLMGLAFVRNINEIADLLGRITGQPVFDPSVYYFSKIPTLVEPWTVVFICLGATSIAVLASVLPAVRAARLHPVRALRYE